MTSQRTAVAIPVQPWFADHRFDGKIVLPAVETMRLLAAEVAAIHPEIDLRIMSDVHFARFLEIPPGCSEVMVLVECTQNENGSVNSKLLSRKEFRTMTRLQEHGALLFFPTTKQHTCLPEITSAPPDVPVTKIPTEQVYRELVPFGPSYQTLQGALHLSGHLAWGRLKAPAFAHTPDRVRDIIGSPFPLDGAFHAACVLGQRFADFVPFPVGFDRRVISNPTQPGGNYGTRVQLLSQNREELFFDLQIFDDQGKIYESVSGIRMRDVSGGKIRPPAWIRAENRQEASARLA